jgi:hypothetical protein
VAVAAVAGVGAVIRRAGAARRPPRARVPLLPSSVPPPRLISPGGSPAPPREREIEAGATIAPASRPPVARWLFSPPPASPPPPHTKKARVTVPGSLRAKYSVDGGGSVGGAELARGRVATNPAFDGGAPTPPPSGCPRTPAERLFAEADAASAWTIAAARVPAVALPFPLRTPASTVAALDGVPASPRSGGGVGWRVVPARAPRGSPASLRGARAPPPAVAAFIAGVPDFEDQGRGPGRAHTPEQGRRARSPPPPRAAPPPAAATPALVVPSTASPRRPASARVVAAVEAAAAATAALAATAPASDRAGAALEALRERQAELTAALKKLHERRASLGAAGSPAGGVRRAGPPTATASASGAARRAGPPPPHRRP